MITTMTCEQFEARLPGFLEADLSGAERDAFERHAESCAHCRPILNDLETIVATAGALGPIEPSRDLWSGIESRITAQVVALAPGRMIPLARAIAAATLLMAATAGLTYQLAKRGGESATTNTAVASSDPQTPSGPGPIIVTSPPQLAINTDAQAVSPNAPATGVLRSTRATRGSESAVSAVRNGSRTVNAATVYDREISRLHSVIESRRHELDPKTVAAIERSLAVIDTAIAQARSALAADPASRFLHGRLNEVLDKKVELLRTTAMLPARS